MGCEVSQPSIREIWVALLSEDKPLVPVKGSTLLHTGQVEEGRGLELVVGRAAF